MEGIAQSTTSLEPRAVERLLLMNNGCVGCNATEWYSTVEHGGSKSDTLTICSYPCGSFANDDCILSVWAFRKRRKCQIYELRRCQEPPISVMRADGAGLRYRVVRQWGRVFITLKSHRLSVASYEVLAMEEGTPGLVNGDPPTLTLRRIRP